MNWKPGRNEARQLRKAGYDGLYNADASCGCLVDDLYPCGEHQDDCKPGVKVPCSGEMDICPCEWHVVPKAGGE